MSMEMRRLYYEARRWIRTHRRQVASGHPDANPVHTRHWQSWPGELEIIPWALARWEIAYKAAERTMR